MSASPQDKSSKPGRKLITSEPKNKRTAQNRAAQRAFRERKERKMKELEDKVQLLEDEKTQIANESDLLRIQVKSLMSQLANYQGDKKQGSTVSSGSTPSDTHDVVSSISSASSMENWKSPAGFEKNTLDFLNNRSFKDEYNEDIFCNNLNEACGTKECPLPKSSSSISSSSIKASPLTFNTVASTDSPFEKMNPAFSNDDMGFLFDQGNTVMFENIPDTDFLKNSTLNIDMYGDLDVELDKNDDVFDEIMKEEGLLDSSIKENLERQAATNTISNPPTNEISTPTSLIKNTNNMDPIDSEIVPNNGLSMMKCSQIWERVTSHPKFTDIDIDGLCEELKQKAKCSERGVVVNGTDVGDILKTAVKQQQQLRKQQIETKGSPNMFLGSTW